VGDRAVVMPGGLEARVRAIQSHGRPLQAAEAGRRVALNLGGVRVEELHRGQTVGAPGAVVETAQFDARVRWIEDVRYASRVRIAVGADEVIGRALPSATEPEYAQFRVERPVALTRGQPVLVRRYSPPDLLGGGEVVVPSAPRRRRSDPPPTWASAAPAGGDHPLVRRVRAAPTGISLGELTGSLGRGADSLGPELAELRARGDLLEFGGLWFTPDRFADCRDRLVAALRRRHEAEPTRAFQPRDRVVREAGLAWEGKSLDRICGFLAGRGELRTRGSAIALPDFQVRLKPRQRELLDRVLAAMDAASPQSPDANAIARALGVPPQAVQEVWQLGLECDELVRLPDGGWLTRAQFDRALRVIRDLAAAGPFGAGEVRDRLQSSRSRVIPLLEYLDAIGVTQRVGDRRILRESGPAQKPDESKGGTPGAP